MLRAAAAVTLFCRRWTGTLPGPTDGDGGFATGRTGRRAHRCGFHGPFGKRVSRRVGGGGGVDCEREPSTTTAAAAGVLICEK